MEAWQKSAVVMVIVLGVLFVGVAFDVPFSSGRARTTTTAVRTTTTTEKPAETPAPEEIYHDVTQGGIYRALPKGHLPKVYIPKGTLPGMKYDVKGLMGSGRWEDGELKTGLLFVVNKKKEPIFSYLRLFHHHKAPQYEKIEVVKYPQRGEVYITLDGETFEQALRPRMGYTTESYVDIIEHWDTYPEEAKDFHSAK